MSANSLAVRRYRTSPPTTQLHATSMIFPQPHLRMSRQLAVSHNAAPDVHSIAVLEVLHAHVFHKVTPEDSRVADQHVDRTKRGLNLVNGAHTLFPLRYIRRHRVTRTTQVSRHTDANRSASRATRPTRAPSV